MMLIFIVFFFFASRRRHTRSTRDWSSDVCSSDLLRSLEATPNNLPRQWTSFVGREAEQAEIARCLGETRVLTLFGMGGLGKTRLSLQVAADAMDDFPDGVWFVELAPLRDAALVAQAV